MEILRIVGESCNCDRSIRRAHYLVYNAVRETLSEDLVERLVVDILEITESLTSKFGLWFLDGALTLH